MIRKARLTRAQQRVIDALKSGATVWQNYSPPNPIWVAPNDGTSEPFLVQRRTLDSLIELGLVREHEPDDDPDFWNSGTVEYLLVAS